MTVNSYLTKLAREAINRGLKKKNIQRSIGSITTKLDDYFEDSLRDHFLFGSYSRNTILPRIMDPYSDVDYMVVFENDGLRPQAYLERLRTFVTRHYPEKSIYKSNPTIVLELNHIRFELVPAVRAFWNDYKIPARASNFNDWIGTNPTDFNSKLIDTNKKENNLIKPLIRLVKYWNTCNDSVFESYTLEQAIVEQNYFTLRATGQAQLKDYFYKFMSNFDVEDAPQRCGRKIEQLHDLISDAKRYGKKGWPDEAESVIRKLLPPVESLEFA